MEIKIGKKEIIAQTFKDCYKVQADFMIGDADGELEETIFIDKENKELGKFLEFLEMCNRAFEECGMGGDDSYSDVPGYSKFTDEYDEDSDEDEDSDNSDEDEDEDEDENSDNLDEDDSDEDYGMLDEVIQKNGICINHPYQPDGSGMECSFEGYSITYFDSVGKEFPVEVTFTDEENEKMRQKMKKAGYEVKKKW